MQSNAKTVEDYIKTLPTDRAEIVARLRELILKNIPEGYHETMNWGMISYEIPLERYPNTYNGQPLSYVALASQKNYLSLYLLNIYGNKRTEEWFRTEYIKSGKKLNVGKSCLRFKNLDDLPLDLIEKTIAMTSVDEYIKQYELNRKIKK